MPDGRWFAYLFRDYGAVGRIPYLVPVRWEDGWPILGIDGKAPDTLDLPPSRGLIPGIVASDDFDYVGEPPTLSPVWQWNHNPDNRYWSLTQRKGYLRHTTSNITDNFEFAHNTLTQRTIGPACVGSIKMDVSHMKDGDFAGLALIQKNYGLVGVKYENGVKRLVMINAQKDNEPQEIENIPLEKNIVYLKAVCYFENMTDTAAFYYSTNGTDWQRIGNTLKMRYNLAHFMGYRFGLFNYATRLAGGYVDFDWFRIQEVYKP